MDFRSCCHPAKPSAKVVNHCLGCRDDFYNGKNDLGVQKCWGLATAEVVMKRFVPLDARPPWNQKPEETFSCHRRPGFVGVKPEITG